MLLEKRAHSLRNACVGLGDGRIRILGLKTLAAVAAADHVLVKGDPPQKGDLHLLGRALTAAVDAVPRPSGKSSASTSASSARSAVRVGK